MSEVELIFEGLYRGNKTHFLVVNGVDNVVLLVNDLRKLLYSDNQILDLPFLLIDDLVVTVLTLFSGCECGSSWLFPFTSNIYGILKSVVKRFAILRVLNSFGKELL